MMDVREYLQRKRIPFTEINNQSGYQAKMNCPKCSDKNSFGINLKTGAFQCFRKNKCGITGNFFDFQLLLGDEPFIKKDKSYAEPKVNCEQPNQKVYDWFAARKISEVTVQHFRIGLSGTGKEIVFLYHKASKIVNAKYRSMSDKIFFKEKECKSTLWNQDSIKGETLFISEGECDCMALKEFGYEGVSIPSGVNDLTWIENDWAFLEKFKRSF